MNRKGTGHRKRLTMKSHYQASIMFYELEKGVVPEWVTWEVKPEHIELLRMFIVEGMNYHEIERAGKVISKQNKPMSADMIRHWIKAYLPFMEYDEKFDMSFRGRDKEDYREFERIKKLMPKDKCAVCGSTKQLEFDHIIPHYAGGKSTVQNLQWLCHSCHDKKTLVDSEKYGW